MRIGWFGEKDMQFSVFRAESHPEPREGVCGGTAPGHFPGSAETSPQPRRPNTGFTAAESFHTPLTVTEREGRAEVQ